MSIYHVSDLPGLEMDALERWQNFVTKKSSKESMRFGKTNENL